MRITAYEELIFEEGKDVVFYLGHEFSLETTSLLKIIPNIKGKSYIINQSRCDLQKLVPFYNIQTVFLQVDHQPIGEAVYLFMQTNFSDLEKIETIIGRRNQGDKNVILLNNPELYYGFVENIGKKRAEIYLPLLPDFRPINVRGMEPEENPFYYTHLFGVKSYIDLYWGDILEKKFGVEDKKGSLYQYFENIRKEKKKELEVILKYKLPGKSLELAEDKFNARPLPLREKIERSIMEADYRKLPELVATLIDEDNSQFNNIYEIVKYLEGKAPNKIVREILESLLKSEDMIIDRRFLPLVYEKLSICYQKDGKYLEAANVYRRFTVIESDSSELKNVNGNFLRKEIELLYLGGEFQQVVELCTEERLSRLMPEDASAVAVCLSLSHNELGNYDIATQYLKGVSEERTFLKKIYRLNKGSLSSRNQEKEEGFSKIALYNEMLLAISMTREGSYLDTIKIFNKMKEKLGKPQNLIGRRALLLVSLFKARALMKTGNIRESLSEYYKNLDNHIDDFEKENRCVVLAMMGEIAELEKSLDNLNRSLEYIEKGLAYQTGSDSEYRIKSNIRLLLLKLEIYCSLGKDEKAVIIEIDELLNERKSKDGFMALKVRMNNILVRSHLSNGRIREALELAEISYGAYKNETEKDIELYLLEILEMAKEQYMATESKDKGRRELQRIADKYLDNVNQDIRIRAALALKELADYEKASGNLEQALVEYGRLHDAFKDNKQRKIVSMLQAANLENSEILFQKEEYTAARTLLLEMEGKMDRETDARRELLLANCNEKLGNRDLAVGGYEEYLEKVSDMSVSSSNLNKVYLTLARLNQELERNIPAVSYLDLFMQNEDNELEILRAMLQKSRILFVEEKEKGYATLKEAFIRFAEKDDNQLIEELLAGCSSKAMEFANNDMELYKKLMGKILARFNVENKATKLNLFESMRKLADRYEEALDIARERDIRNKIVEYFSDPDSPDYQVESAYNYYRVLIISLRQGIINDIDASYEEFKVYYLHKEEDYARECYHKAMLAFGKEYIKRSEFKRAKSILGELLSQNKEMHEARLYYAIALKALGEKKKALKEFKEITETNISGKLFRAVIEKIALIKGERSLFNSNIKKLIKEIEERIIPIVNTDSNNLNKLTIGYELALLYKELKNQDKYQEILKGLLESYSVYEDQEIKEKLKLIEMELEG